jgi:hypothetical protein
MRAKKRNIPGVCDDPCEGVWYWVYLKPDWRFFHVVGKIGHPAFWRETAAPSIARHYKLSSSRAWALESLYYAMPRGRVVLWEDGKAYVGHGGDAPKLIGDVAIKTVISAFGLSRLMMVKRVVITVEPHEKMERSHVKKFWNLIGVAHGKH